MEQYQDLEPGYRMRTDIRDEYLQNWVFHYNPYREIWYAIPRESYLKFWQGGETDGVQKSQNLTTLLELLYKTQGNIDKMNSYCE